MSMNTERSGHISLKSDSSIIQVNISCAAVWGSKHDYRGSFLQYNAQFEAIMIRVHQYNNVTPAFISFYLDHSLYLTVMFIITLVFNMWPVQVADNNIHNQQKFYSLPKRNTPSLAGWEIYKVMLHVYVLKHLFKLEILSILAASKQLASKFSTPHIFSPIYLWLPWLTF